MALIRSARDDPSTGPDEGRPQDRRGRRNAQVARTEALWNDDPALRRAYDRGRRDERARRKRGPGSMILSLLVFTAAAAGVFVIYLGVSEGSFSKAGRVVDNSVASAARTTRHTARQAANQVGDAFEGAGRSIKDGVPQG
jgi:hypothetical protein